MKTGIFGSIILIIAFACKNEKMQIEYNEDGEIIYLGKEVKGLKQGSWIRFNNEGDTIYLEKYENDILIQKVLYEDNIQVNITNYLDGKKHGKFKSLNLEKGSRCEGYYNKGKLDGVMICYNKDDVIIKVSRFNKGKPFAHYQFYDDGDIQFILTNFDEGVGNLYDSLGFLESKLMYKNRKLVDTLYLEK